MNVHGQWYLPWMQAAGGQVGQVVIPQQAQTQHAGHAAQAQQALSNPASLDKSGQVWTGNAVSASAQQQLLQQQYMQQQQQLLKYLNQGNCDMWRVKTRNYFFVKQLISYLKTMLKLVK